MIGGGGRRWSRHAPAFLAITLTVGTGLGAAAAVGSFVERALLRALPYAHPARMVRLETVEPRRGAAGDNAIRDVFDYAATAEAVTSVTPYFISDYNLAVDGRAVPLTVTFTSARAWSLTGVSPALGATFSDEHDRPGGDVRKVVLSDGLWRRQFGAAPDVVGRIIHLGTAPYEIVGIMPRGFGFPERSDAWAPLEAWLAYLGTSSASVARGARSYGAAARLRDGMSMADARGEAQAIAARLATEHPATNRGVQFVLQPFAARLSAASRPFLLLGAWAVAALLITSLGAAAALFSARRVARRQVVALQVALGATRSRLAFEGTLDAIPLAASTSVVGLVSGTALTAAISRAVPEPHPGWLEGGLTLAAGLMLTGAALLIAGLGCAVRPAERDPVSVVRRFDAAPALRRRRLLTGLQAALAVGLLLAAVTFIGSLRRILDTDAGFATAGAVAVYVSPPGDDMPAAERRTRYAAFYDQVIDELRALPGVDAAAGINVLPLRSRAGWQRNSVTAMGQDAERQAGNPVVSVLRASDGYFETMAIPMLGGREFDGRDSEPSARVAIVSASLAQRLWPSGSAVGRQLKLGTPEASTPWTTVIGVAADVRSSLVGDGQGYDLYLPYRQVIAGELYFVIRTDRPPNDVVAAAAAIVGRINPHAAVFRTFTIEALVDDSIWQQRLWTWTMAVFAVAACTVAAASVYAVALAFVAARRREFAIRAALGATPRELLALASRESLGLAGAGVFVGLVVGTFALWRASTIIAGLGHPSWISILTVSGVTVGLFALASSGPLRSASAIDPASALRSE